jgi:hypothetical protein
MVPTLDRSRRGVTLTWDEGRGDYTWDRNEERCDHIT